MATELAKAYVQIVPSAEGISGSLSNVLGNEATAAGKSAGGKFSSAMGGVLKTGAAAIAGIGRAGFDLGDRGGDGSGWANRAFFGGAAGQHNGG